MVSLKELFMSWVFSTVSHSKKKDLFLGEINIQAADFATYPRILQIFPKKYMMPFLKCPNKKARQKGIIQPLKFLLAFSRPQGDLLFLYVLHITNVVFGWLPGSGLWCLSIDGALYHC